MKQFDTVPIQKPSKNVFNLSHDVKSSYNFDKLYPFFCHPVYPGETFNVKAEVFLRAMPMFAPVMHNVDMFLYFFFVPFRLEWNERRKNDWRTFITGGEDGKFGAYGYDNVEQDFVLPHFDYAMIAAMNTQGKQFAMHGSLLDHMGFPTVGPNMITQLNGNHHEPICSLPFRAYQDIWNEYFRNQNVQNEIEYSRDSGKETSTNLSKLLSFRKKCWEKDYFTSCLPFQQRGEAVKLPIKINTDPDQQDITAAVLVEQMKQGVNGSDIQIAIKSGSGASAYSTLGVKGSDAENFTLGSSVQLTGTATINSSDLVFSGVDVGTITDFRYCLRLQQWLENNARCGSRYIEQILAHFGVTSSDARLQRPELLGGGKIPLIFSDVPQTSSTDSESVQGNLAGKGTLYGKTGGFKKYFEEHGVLIGLLCIIPRTSYSQGIPRYWTAMDKTDWYFPEFAHLSEQAVLNKEVYFNPTVAPALTPEDGPDGVFGYQGRFTELRYVPSSFHGDLRGDLSYWHMGRIFSQQPALNGSFVEAKSDARIFAIEDIANSTYDPFVCQTHLDVRCVRPMPKFAVPTL